MGLTQEEIIDFLFSENTTLGKEFITECQKRENEYFIENGGHIYKNTLDTIYTLHT